MYSLTRSSIDSQLARMHSGIRNVVRITNSIEMPSTPMLVLDGTEPSPLLDELEGGAGLVELPPDQQGHSERGERRPQRDPARVLLGFGILRGDDERTPTAAGT